MDLDAIVIVFLVIVAPIWLFLHYGYRWRSAKGLSDEDSRLMEEIWERVGAMEERIRALETILDEEAPNWRRRL